MRKLSLLVLVFVVFGCSNPGPKTLIFFPQKTIDFTSRDDQFEKYVESNIEIIDTIQTSLHIKEEILSKFNTFVLIGTQKEALTYQEQTEINRFVQAGGKVLELEKWDEASVTHISSNSSRLDYKKATIPRVPDDNRFHKQVLHQRFDEPMELAVMNNGNVLIVERKGAVKLYNGITQKVSKVGHIPINNFEEDGLLGITLDPDFDQNHWIYAFYSPVGDDPVQYVSRFDFRDSVILDSEKIILKIKTQRLECCHSAGSLEFGPKGHLWISVGDNTNPFESNGYNPIDERAGRSPFDAQKSSANTNDLRGKILRITPQKDGTYTIPDGNLFPKDGSKGRPEIYIMGCRNPFRFAIDSRTYFVYWGEIGPDANVDKEDRGPRGHDEFNQARGPGFFGWPYFVGNNKAYRDPKLFSGKGEGNIVIEGSEIAFDPNKPINDSPNNTGERELPPAQPAFIYYPYARSAEFPMLGAGSRNAMAGPVYYSEDYMSSTAFPAYFDGKPFFYDWMRNWIFLVRTDENGDLEGLERFAPKIKYNNLMDMEFGKDGSLYVLEYGTGWFLENPDSRLSRISYNPGNRPPDVAIQADKRTGGVPLTVQFQSTVVDHDGDEVSYKWWFDGEAPQSHEPHPSFTFERTGRFNVLLKVKDSKGDMTDAMIEIQVGNEAPVLDFHFLDNQSFTANKSFWWPHRPIQYEVSVTDREDGKLGKGIAEEDVVLTIDYLPEGEDLTEIAQGHQAGASLQTGASLIAANNCQSCHQEKEKLVGPGFLQVAEKYRNQADALAYLTHKILNGGSGVWGEQAMAAQAQLAEREAAKIAAYIMNLGQAQATKAKPLKGLINTSSYSQGTFVLEASYTDQGGNKTDPITQYGQLILRHGGHIEAENFDQANGIIPKQFSQDVTPYLDNLRPGNHVLYQHIDLTSIQSVQYIWRGFGGGIVEMRIDSYDGPIICTHNYAEFANDQNLIQPIISQKGFHDIYLTFRHQDGSSGNVGGLDRFVFRPE